MAERITDPALLEQLNAPDPNKVTDPALLEELEAYSPNSRRAKFARGLQAGTVKAGMGLAGLVGLGPQGEEREAILREINKDMEEAGGWGTAGEIASNVALTAIPGTAAYRAATVAPRFFPKALGQADSVRRGLIAAAPTGAVIEAAITPGDMAERGKAALYGAAGGTVGEVGGRVLRRALTQPVIPSKSAERLMELGIQPTVGQGAKSSIVHGAEDLVAGLPVAGQIVRSGQRRAMKEAEQAFLTTGTPLAEVRDDLIQKLGRQPTTREEIAALGAAVTDAYERQLAKLFPKPLPMTSELRLDMGARRDALPTAVREEWEGVVAPYMQKGELTGQELHNMVKELGELASDYLKSGSAAEKRLGRALQSQQGRLKEVIFGKHLEEIDDAYRNLVRIRRAGSYLGTAEGITPRHMERAVRRESGPTAFAEGKATLQDLSDPAQILKESPNSGLSMLTSGGAALLGHHLTGGPIIPAVATGLITAGSFRPVAKFALGGNPWQRAMAARLRSRQPIGAVMGAGASGPFTDE